jgi:hypothetical protein
MPRNAGPVFRDTRPADASHPVRELPPAECPVATDPRSAPPGRPEPASTWSQSAAVPGRDVPNFLQMTAPSPTPELASAAKPMFDLADSEGVNESERVLTQLCHKSFLRLWSQTNVFTDEGFKEG